MCHSVCGVEASAAQDISPVSCTYLCRCLFLVTHPFIRILSNRLAQGLLSSRPWSWHPISGGGGQHWALCVSFESSGAPGHRYHAPAAVAPQLASRHGAVSYQWPHRLPVTGKQFSIELWLYLAQDGLCKGKKEFFFFVRSVFFCGWRTCIIKCRASLVLPESDIWTTDSTFLLHFSRYLWVPKSFQLLRVRQKEFR